MAIAKKAKERIYPLVEIKDGSDIVMLQEIYNCEIISAEMFCQRATKLRGKRVTIGSLKQRRARGTLISVGYMGHNKRSYWYPVSELEYYNKLAVEQIS